MTRSITDYGDHSHKESCVYAKGTANRKVHKESRRAGSNTQIRDRFTSENGGFGEQSGEQSYQKMFNMKFLQLFKNNNFHL